MDLFHIISYEPRHYVFPLAPESALSEIHQKNVKTDLEQLLHIPYEMDMVKVFLGTR